MCQPKSRGGQRCAAHTRADMQAAETRYATDPSVDNHDALQAARAEYAATPSGKDDLEAQLAATAGSPDAVDLEAALRRGAQIRERNQAVRATADDLDLAARLTGMTPAEVDTELGKKWEEMYKVEDRLQQARRSLDYQQQRASRGNLMPWQERELDQARERIASYEEELEKMRRGLAPYDEEFRRRGGWSRFYETTGSNSHIHGSMGCVTCFPTTRYGWHPEMSGKSESEAVAEFGEKMCTCCYPSAPTDPNFSGPGRRDREAQDARRTEREQRAAEKAAKAITHRDGGKLRDASGDEIKTLRTAQITLVSHRAYIAHLAQERDNPSYIASTPEETRAHYQSLIDKYERGVFDIEEAIAAKTGQTVEEIRAEATPKVEKKVRAGTW